VDVTDDAAWAVTSTGSIYSYVGGTTWKLRPGVAVDVACGSSAVYVLGPAIPSGGHNIYKWNGANFERLTGVAYSIEASRNGTPYVIGLDWVIYVGE
jgi:hypothetical protein